MEGGRQRPGVDQQDHSETLQRQADPRRSPKAIPQRSRETAGAAGLEKADAERLQPRRGAQFVPFRGRAIIRAASARMSARWRSQAAYE